MRQRQFWLTTSMLLVAPMLAFGQFDRRDRREPALALDVGGRTAYCDVLSFSEDGKYLLAAGDDKIVTIWKHHEAGFEAKPVQTLRWPSWREQRGGVYAMAISPNDGGRRVAVAGLGLRSTAVAILDRDTGAIVESTYAEEGNRNFYNVTALAFSPDGKKLAIGTGEGSVWVWSPGGGKPIRLGGHGPIDPRRPENVKNWVRLLRFRGDNMLSLAEDGRLIEWNTAARGSQTEILRVGLQYTVRAAALSPDNKWLVAAVRGPVVAFRSLDGATADIKLPENSFGLSIGFSSDGQRVAVGVNSILANARFFLETGGRVNIYDLAGRDVKQVQELPHVGRAEALAWHGRERLAVAGGDNHEITLWNPDRADRPLSVIRGAGRAIWSIRLTEDGKHIVWQDERDPNARHPNRRGKGDWKVFALEDRRFLPKIPEKARLVEPIETFDGWRVVPDESDSSIWYAVHEQRNLRLPLPLDRTRDQKPHCYTFLADGRLAVGHYWGVSLFRLTATEAKRTQLMVGHQGEVFAIAASADGSWLVSAGNDQTVAGFSLRDWPTHPTLGASCDQKLVVADVDIGSPAWEAGLASGDRIELLAVDGKRPPVYESATNTGNIAAALAALADPEPGKELYIGYRRAGVPQRMEQLTTVRRRPLWRLFGAADQRDWVMWMWHGSFYDTSTNGDYLIGWLLNDPSLEREPRFFRAEQFRRQFHNETVIDRLLQTRDVGAALRLALGNNPVPIRLGDIEPPAAQIRVAGGGGDPYVATLRVAPRGDNPDFQPRRVELWINDYRFKVWHELPPGPFDAKVEIFPSQLRIGENRLTLQAFNRLGGRSDAVATVDNQRVAGKLKPRLLGLAVGIDDYSQVGLTADGSRKLFGNLASSKRDAEAQKDKWSTQAGKLYREANIMLRVDANAKRDSILAALDSLRKETQPDDLLVLFMSGHGDFLTEGKEAKSKSTFVFCGPNYAREKFRETGVDNETLFERLAAIPCRKVVFLDACHAGEAVYNPVRTLTPNGQGPIILAACDRTQFSFEHEKYGHGLFTYAVLQAFDKGFADADRSGPDGKPDGRLDAVELYDYICKQMPGLLRSIDKPEYAQMPQCFPRELERFPLIER